LLTRLVLTGPLLTALIGTLLEVVPWLAELIGPGQHTLTSGSFYRDALVSSLVLFFGGVLAGLVVVATVPRVLNLAIKPNAVYPLYGFHYWIQRMIARLTIHASP